jgi:cytochrome c oxidase subunit 4
MADEVNNPTPIDPENPPEAIEEIQDESIRELRDVPVETIPTDELDAVAAEIKEEEPSVAREERREAEAALNKPIEAIEDAVNELDSQDQAALAHVLPHIMPDTTVVFGRTFPFPVYTVVYIVLALITLIEVLITGFPHGWLLTITLLGLSIAKMVLVVLFYMHLKEDSKLFAAAIILPLFIIIVATLFLIAAPSTGY